MKRYEEWILLHLKPRNFQTHLNKNVLGCKHIRFAIHIDFVSLMLAFWIRGAKNRCTV